MVCYSPEKHDTLLNIEKQQKAIKVGLFRERPALNNPQESAIVINQNTTFDTTSVDFTFTPPNCNPLKISQIKKFSNTTDKVSLTGKVLFAYPPQQVAQKNTGKILNKQEFLMGDETGSIKVCLWESNIPQITVHKTYEMQNTTVNKYQDLVSINTSMDTIIRQTANMETVQMTEQMKSATGEIMGVLVNLNQFCNQCRKQLPQNTYNPKTPKFKCPTCQWTQKTSTITSRMWAELTLRPNTNEGTDLILTCPDSVLADVMQQQTTDLQLVENYLLDFDNCTIKYTNDNTITEIIPHHLDPQ